jgi:hypothetical protein
MSLIEASALVVVVLAGVYLLALGTASLVAPARAGRFLLGFASSRPVHFAELAVRSVIGAALIIHAPRMLLPAAFNVFGWLLLVTTACLLLVPWQWHHRFARQAVPRAIRHITLIGLASLVFGGVILGAVARGGGT